MRRWLGVAMVTFCLLGVCGPGRADSKEAAALVDKAIQAVGGADKLGKITVVTWKAKGTLTFNGSDNPITTQLTAQGLDHGRSEFQGEFGGNAFKAVTAVAGDKGFRDFAGNHMDLTTDAIANEKRTLYLEVIPVTLVALKGTDYTLDTVPDVTADGKTLAGIKVTAPDKKDFTLYFDKDSGLPAKLVAKVVGFDGQEYTQETVYSDFKDMAGIKKATKVVSRRNGTKFLEEQVTDFDTPEKTEAKTFTDL